MRVVWLICLAYFGGFWLFIHYALDWDEFGTPWFFLCMAVVTAVIGTMVMLGAPL